MDDADDRLLGLFPLGIVLLPGEVVPLHIFEERYKKLIGERLEERRVRHRAGRGRQPCASAARTARVAQLIEELDDGRMNVLVQGERRFRIARGARARRPRGRLPERARSTTTATPSRRRRSCCARASLEVFEQHARAHGRGEPREPAGEGPLSFRVAAAVDFGAPLKQELLESLSEEQRLETLLTVMTSLLPRLELRKEREEAIRGNGKGY